MKVRVRNQRNFKSSMTNLILGKKSKCTPLLLELKMPNICAYGAKAHFKGEN